MNKILYYSNKCKHCATILDILSKTPIKNKFFYVCVDNRVVDANGNVYTVTPRGVRVPLPKTIEKVPALMLPENGCTVLTDMKMNHCIQTMLREVEYDEDDEVEGLDLQFNHEMTSRYGNINHPSDVIFDERTSNSSTYSCVDMDHEPVITPPEGSSYGAPADAARFKMEQQRRGIS